MERRANSQSQLQTATGKADGQGRTVRGYAASFGTPTVIRDAVGREFREVISPDAFNRTLQERPDIRLLRDHEPALLLGRTKAGTLAVGVDDTGLWFECQLPDSQAGRDVAEAIKRGDLDSCSFGFRVLEDSWGLEGDTPTRELRDVELYEVSIVAFPAYEAGTSVDLRSISLSADDMAKRKTNTARVKLWLMKNR